MLHQNNSTHTNPPIPFKLWFTQYNKDHHTTAFFLDEYSFYEEKVEPLKFTENVELVVSFESNDAEARFYMDGLETLPEKKVEIDEEGSVYLPPTQSEPLYSKNYFPLIPAIYRIMVVVNGKKY